MFAAQPARRSGVAATSLAPQDSGNVGYEPVLGTFREGTLEGTLESQDHPNSLIHCV
jgi:hypothetical protein